MVVVNYRFDRNLLAALFLKTLNKKFNSQNFLVVK